MEVSHCGYCGSGQRVWYRVDGEGTFRTIEVCGPHLLRAIKDMLYQHLTTVHVTKFYSKLPKKYV